MSAHAILAASAAPQWGYCSGSVAANAAAPNLDSMASRVGTATHWCGETVLRAFAGQIEDGPLLCPDLIGQTAPNGVVIDDAMAEGAQTWVDDVLQVCNEYGALRAIRVEQRVHMPHIHEHNWGTPDTALSLPEQKLLYVWDYKNGHRLHEPQDHLQLIDYVFGLAYELQLPKDTQVIMRIAQPYAYKPGGPVSEWRVSLNELGDKWFEHLRRQAAEVFTNPTLTPGAHCRDCEAVGRCAAARKAAYSVMSYAKEPYEIDTLSGRDLAVERRLLEVGEIIIKARRKAIDDEIAHRIGDGATDTGLTLETKYSNLDWAVPVEQAIALASQFGADIAKPGAKTPTQARAAVPAKLRLGFDEVLKTVATRKPNGLKLIPADNARTAQAFKKSK